MHFVPCCRWRRHLNSQVNSSEEQQICHESILLQLPFPVSEIIQNGGTKRNYNAMYFNLSYEVLRSGNKISKQKNEMGYTTQLQETHFLRTDLQIQVLLPIRGAPTALS